MSSQELPVAPRIAHLGASVEAVVPSCPGERTEHHGLAVAVRAGGVEEVTEQEEEGADKHCRG
jgi:hypothetical protein